MADIKMIALVDIPVKIPESVDGIVKKGTEFTASKEWCKKLEKINNAIKSPSKEKKAVKPYSKKKVDYTDLRDIKDKDGLSK